MFSCLTVTDTRYLRKSSVMEKNKTCCTGKLKKW